jgi:hypothetical protein
MHDGLGLPVLRGPHMPTLPDVVYWQMRWRECFDFGWLLTLCRWHCDRRDFAPERVRKITVVFAVA